MSNRKGYPRLNDIEEIRADMEVKIKVLLIKDVTIFSGQENVLDKRSLKTKVGTGSIFVDTELFIKY